MQQWVVTYWDAYAPMVNWVSGRSLLAIASLHDLSIIIEIALELSFTQVDLNVDVFMKIPLGVRVDGNRGVWVLKLNKSLYEIKQSSAN